MSMKIDQYFWIRPFKTERNANHVIHACVNYKASVRLNPKKEDDFFFFFDDDVCMEYDNRLTKDIAA